MVGTWPKVSKELGVTSPKKNQAERSHDFDIKTETPLH